ncbi:hypothetical protein [Oceanobacillus jeddahense]|uniref:MFS transporter n=1 Tax=Oceanobacillus jeddahense TaxID=1462527 RepID=A0ABY5JLZ7_9BACI|nr:hypothetical protein [Oceanobacillus jeddahense]UUI01156.1 hypothetical protein NP439_13910 [Oceanobacillus jeddahense]
MEKKRVKAKNSLSLEASSNKRILYLITIMVIGFNLRPAITSVGPLLGTIRDQIGLENWSAGTITSLPLIAAAPWIQ